MILAFLALAWLLGIAAAAFTGADAAATVAAAGLLGCISFALRPRASTLVLIATGVALVFTAAWRYESTTPSQSPTGVARYNDGQPVRLRAVVDAEPDDRGTSRLYRLQVREAFVESRWRPESGGVLMRGAAFPQYEYGDLLEIEGKLEKPPALDDFDYREYLLRRGIASIITHPKVRPLAEGEGNPISAALIDLRSRLSGALSDALPEPEASLAGGILLGARSQIPQDLKDDMNATGTSHLVAVSGQNVTLVAALLMAVLAWIIGRRPAAWLALAGILVYAALVGAQPSVLRAAIMGGLYVVAIALGRQNTAPIALLIAAAGMMAFDPQLAHDVSFQLSFAATLGLIALSPLLRDRAESLVSRWPAVHDLPLTRPAIEMAAVTTAAIAFTLPITAVNFHRISLAAPLANLFAVPAFIAVAMTSALTALVGVIVGDAGFLVWLAWPPAAYMIAVVRFFADLPLASVELRGVTTAHAVAYYAILLGGVWLLARRPVALPEPPPAVSPTVSRRALPAAALLLLLALSSTLLWLAVTAPSSGRLSVTILDVGQGDAILIEGPEGNRVLVDGGPSGEAITSALGRHLPFYDRRIDLIVLTHAQADHLGGLPTVLERYDVGGVLATRFAAESALYQDWTKVLSESHVARPVAMRGEWVDLGDGTRLTVLNPSVTTALGDASGLNDTSVVLRLTMGDASILLTGDISQAAEAALIRQGTDLRATVLKVPHHGSRTSSSPQFLSRVDPLIDVISVGAGNSFGHPTQETLDRLQGDAVLRTDENGDVTVSTDGEGIWVETQR